MLGLTGKESNWGTGIEQNNIGFMQYTLLPLATTWEKAIRRQLFTEDEKRQGYYVKHNMAALLRGDLKSQAEALTLYVREGAMTPDEAREILDRNPHAGGVGAKPYMQAQMTPMDKLGQHPQPAAATNQ
jgi:HK97 family phage portal protein